MDVGRGLVILCACALLTACADEKPAVSAECIKVVDESGEATDACLPIAPQSERVDLATPTFSNPTSISNPLHPTSLVDQVIMGGHVDGKPFRTEVTRLPGTKSIPMGGKAIDTAIIQYVAYLDGRIHEVALDWYAQADDGSVWYLGEDVFNYEDGRIADTNGTWIAGETTPAAMIMPAKPQVGDVYRPENAPGVVFEEVRVEKVDQTIPGPSGTISGAVEVTELHMDGTAEGKVFAPGYGEFSNGTLGGDLEAVSLASPNDSRQGSAPAEFTSLSKAVDGVYQAAAAEDPERLARAVSGLTAAWEAVRAKGVPPQMTSQMTADIDTLHSGDVHSAALRIAQNELDLRLLYEPIIDVDLARLQLWARQLPVDVADGDTGLVLANVAALDRVWERTKHGVEPAAPVDTALQELQMAADPEDLAAVDRAAASLSRAISALRTR
jgi:hypothetical protein